MAHKRGKESDEIGASGPTRKVKRTPESGGSLNSIPEWMRKIFGLGFSGFFLTEEAIRKALGDTLPRDWADFAVEQSERTRSDFLERLSFEIGQAVENIDLAEVFQKLLEGRTLEVRAEIRLKGGGRGGATKLDVSARSRAKKD